MRRLTEITGLFPVEYPTTRELNASPEARATDVNAAFADPDIHGIIATIGGDDQITVIPHLDSSLITRNPKPFLGYSDNTNLHNFLWSLGIASFYGGSTQVHLGPGPFVDDVHALSLRAALLEGGRVELIDPGHSEDFGLPWTDKRALTDFGVRTPTEPWTWSGPEQIVEGITWGGCLEVIDQLALAGRLPSNEELAGAILVIETSELLPDADQVSRWIRSLGERGLLSSVNGVLVARPPVSALGAPSPSSAECSRLRADQRDAVVNQVQRYNADAVICVGVPFGHTRPQWIIPYGGSVSLDGKRRIVRADYGEPNPTPTRPASI